MALDHGVHAPMVQHQLGPEEYPREALVAGAQGIRTRHERVPSRGADVADPSAIGDRRDAALERPPADGVDDEVRAMAARQLLHRADEVARPIVDAVVEAVLLQALELRIARRRR